MKSLVRRITERTRRISFKWRIVFVCSLVIALTSNLVGLSFYLVSIEQMLGISKDMAYEILIKNNQILDERLQKIKENSAQAVSDYALFEYLRNEERLAEQNVMGLDRRLSQLLNKYFPSSDVLSVQIVTERGVYGNNTSLLTPGLFKASQVYREAAGKGGALLWTPVYDFVQMYGLREYARSPMPDRQIFSAVRVLGNSYMDTQGIYERASFADSELPVLLINFSERTIGDIFEGSMPVQGASTYILSPQGDSIYASGASPLDLAGMEDWFQTISHKVSGSDILRVGGEDVAVCYDTSDVTGWISLVVMPSDQLMKSTRDTMQIAVMVSIVVVAAIGFLLAVLISSMVARPVNRMVSAMQSIGGGDFDTRLPVESRDEFGYLVEGFNAMNRRIGRLIEDNYASKLRENELEIMALNLQMNPHFLYNTLSVINYEAIDSGQDRVSEMIMNLCDMLSYTFRSKNETASFREDLRWLHNYIAIMRYRFENKFEVVYDIDEALMDLNVPKLFLQPFVENAILHGFEFIDSGGIIRITGRAGGGRSIFTVEDNGVGMEHPEGQLDARSAVGSIGISNTNKRIRLLYGVEYGVAIASLVGEGTRVTITLPDITIQ